MEVEMDTICLSPLPGPPAPALPAPMVQDPPPTHPVDRKGKAPICTAPRPQLIKLVVAFQRPPPPINLASHPCKLFAAAVRDTKGPVKAAAPVIQPAAAQSGHVPSFTAPGPTRRQVLVSFQPYKLFEAFKDSQCPVKLKPSSQGFPCHRGLPVGCCPML